jgi:hypothetical protein
MSWLSRILTALTLAIVLAAVAQVIGVITTFVITLAICGAWIHSVGWKRAIFPFVANLHEHR